MVDGRSFLVVLYLKFLYLYDGVEKGLVWIYLSSCVIFFDENGDKIIEGDKEVFFLKE